MALDIVCDGCGCRAYAARSKSSGRLQTRMRSWVPSPTDDLEDSPTAAPRACSIGCLRKICDANFGKIVMIHVPKPWTEFTLDGVRLGVVCKVPAKAEAGAYTGKELLVAAGDWPTEWDRKTGECLDPEMKGYRIDARDLSYINGYVPPVKKASKPIRRQAPLPVRRARRAAP